MLAILLNVIGPVAVVAFVGFVWGRARQPFDAPTFSMVATYVGTPCLIVDSLATSGLRRRQPRRRSASGRRSARCSRSRAGYALVIVSRQPMSTYLPASTFANCGNIGLPLALFAFGKDGLALAIAYLAVHGVFNFVIGQALAAGRFSLRETLLSPLLWATALGAILSVTGSALPAVARPRRPHPRRPDHPDDAAGARLCR